MSSVESPQAGRRRALANAGRASRPDSRRRLLGAERERPGTIEKLGARKPSTEVPVMSSSRSLVRRTDCRNWDRVWSVTRAWSQPCDAISWPARAIARINGAFRCATQPSTKNVARTLCRANSSSSRPTSRVTRDSKRSQSDRATLDANAETWKYSSKSIVKWWASITLWGATAMPTCRTLSGRWRARDAFASWPMRRVPAAVRRVHAAARAPQRGARSRAHRISVMTFVSEPDAPRLSVTVTRIVRVVSRPR